MREILFRGQTRRYGEKTLNVRGDKMPSNWVYGGIFPSHNGSKAIIYQQEPTIEKFTVYADTVGQYTGLRDKNGARIFEGDICKDESSSTYLIVWRMHQWQCKVIHSDCVLVLDCSFPLWQWDNCKENGYRTLEIIGNIHDNPDLMNTATGEDNGNAAQCGLLPATL